MSDWPLFSIDEIASQHKNALATGPFGSSIGTSTFRTTGVPLIRGSNLSADVSTRLIEDEFVFVDEDLARKFDRSIASLGDIVFTCWGTINQVGIIDKGASFDRYLVSNKQMKLTVDTRKALPLYVYYFFSGPAGQAEIDMGAIGSSVPGFNLTKLRKIKIPLPSMYVQRKIVDILDGLDNKVQLNRQMNETLEATARAIFKDWFVDFGPTRAKMAGTKPYLAPEIWNLFPDRINDEGKPVGWREQTLSELCTLGRGASPRPINDYMNGEIPWIKIADATSADGPFLFETREKVTEAGSKQSVEVTFGDLILSNSATCGLPIFVELNGCIHDGWLYFKKLKTISKLYLYHILTELANHLVQIADGSVQKNLNTHLVGQQKVLIPSKDILDAFDAYAIPSFNKIRENSLESRTLASTRDLLLPKLMSGEIRIKDAETIAKPNLAIAN